MSKLHEAWRKLRGGLAAPPALRRFGIGGHPVLQGCLTQFKSLFQRKKAAE